MTDHHLASRGRAKWLPALSKTNRYTQIQYSLSIDSFLSARNSLIRTISDFFSSFLFSSFAEPILIFAPHSLCFSRTFDSSPASYLTSFEMAVHFDVDEELAVLNSFFFDAEDDVRVTLSPTTHETRFEAIRERNVLFSLPLRCLLIKCGYP